MGEGNKFLLVSESHDKNSLFNPYNPGMLFMGHRQTE